MKVFFSMHYAFKHLFGEKFFILMTHYPLFGHEHLNLFDKKISKDYFAIDNAVFIQSGEIGVISPDNKHSFKINNFSGA